ncbi:hypothetical protein [Novosphingobium sp.]|uniref:hypothetical protein n=1 Tax=Novosphingobium sp. TaxID=1874826 RepID=UPI0026270231|nr:hypothetical protein [Novosphingobium sp.]
MSRGAIPSGRAIAPSPALRWTAPLLAGALVLGGCQKADNEPGPGGVTVGEARALDRAAAMIEGQAPPEPAPAASGAAPVPTAAAPH